MPFGRQESIPKENAAGSPTPCQCDILVIGGRTRISPTTLIGEGLAKRCSRIEFRARLGPNMNWAMARK